MKRHALATGLACAFAAAARAAAGEALPPEATVRAALESAPVLRAARESLASGEAQARRRQVGPYEWEASARTQSRTDAAGFRYDEQEFELSRSLRLPGKAQLDRHIADAERRVGEFSYEDAWHEAGRSLLSGWMEVLRQDRRAARIAEQQAAVAQLLDAVRRRYAAGDAPRVDLDLAEAEQAKLAAHAIATHRDLELARGVLESSYPSLDAPLPTTLEAPPELPGSDAEWIARITGHNHEVELAEGHAETASLLAQRAAKDRLPDPNVGLRYSDNLDGNRRVVGVRIAIPLGLAGRDADAALARSTARRATAEAERTRLRVASEARAAVLGLNGAKARWERLQVARERASAAADSAARGYALGEVEIALMLTAQRQAAEATEDADVALVDLLEARARLQLDAHQLWALDDPGH